MAGVFTVEMRDITELPSMDQGYIVLPGISFEYLRTSDECFPQTARRWYLGNSCRERAGILSRVANATTRDGDGSSGWFLARSANRRLERPGSHGDSAGPRCSETLRRSSKTRYQAV